jgi:hypothetical protein
MSAIWTLDEPCDHALLFDCCTLHCRAAGLADVHSDEFFVRILVHVDRMDHFKT